MLSHAFKRVLGRPVGGSTRVVHPNRGSDRVEVCSMEVSGGNHPDGVVIGALNSKDFGAGIHIQGRCMALGHCKWYKLILSCLVANIKVWPTWLVAYKFPRDKACWPCWSRRLQLLAVQDHFWNALGFLGGIKIVVKQRC